jgi:hypothetical protein
MDTKKSLIQLIEMIRKMKQELLDNLTDEERAEMGTLELWSAKDLVVHLVYWRKQNLKNIETELAGQSREPGPDFDFNHINDRVFNEKKDCTWAEVLKDDQDSYTSYIEMIASISEEDLVTRDRFPTPGGRPLISNILGVECWHSVWHMSDFHLKRSRLADANAMQNEFTDQVVKFPGWDALGNYNLACYYSVSGQSSKAFAPLAESFRLNPELIEYSHKDIDLDPLRSLPDFKALLEMV